MTAALLTRTSIGPSCSRAVATSRSRSAASARLAWIATARPPVEVIASTVSLMEPGSRGSVACVVRAVTATAAPASAKRCAIAAPMPRLAPVTIATLPERSVMQGP